MDGRIVWTGSKARTDHPRNLAHPWQAAPVTYDAKRLRSGATLALVIGERDLADGSVQLKTMETGEQVSVPLAQVVSDVINTLKLSKDGRNQQ